MSIFLILSLLLNLILLFFLLKSKFRPERLLAVFTKRFKAFWKKISFSNKRKAGRPPISSDIKDIIKKILLENIKIGGLHIWMNLIHLGYDISLSSVYRAIRVIKNDLLFTHSLKWKSFLSNSKVIAMDFLTASVEISKDVFQQVFIFIIIDHNRRKVLFANCTPYPNERWVLQQFKNCFENKTPYRYVIHDRDSIFMHGVRKFLPVFFNLKSTPTAPHSPWQNPFVESFNGTLRRELLNHVIIKDQFHLQKLLNEYINFYNNHRMHSSLMDSPEGMKHHARPPDKNALRKLKSIPVLNGLHHIYYWQDAA